LKLKLNEKQVALLDEINAPYSPDKEYDGNSLLDLEDFISDHALYSEQNADGMTKKGEDLLDLVSCLAMLEDQLR
jgi:hypothetical protein